MSAKSEQLEGTGAGDEVCASCGVAGVDNVKLKKCACNLVKYCSVDCQKNHRKKHKQACKKKMAELRDRDLFTQSESSFMGECPICCLPLHLQPKKHTIMMSCCSKYICNGCNYANQKAELEQGLQQRCAFCREPAPESDEKADKQIMKRIKKHNDPVAMTQMGKSHYGEGDYGKALEYFTKATELGDTAAHFCLGLMYYHEDGVEKDKKKGVYHFEQAAIGGHPGARCNLAVHEMKRGRPDRAARHQIIAANLGCDTSLEAVKMHVEAGVVSKEEYGAALRGYQAAVNLMKSAERDKAEAYYASRGT
jgi:hypothetical protein